MFHFRVCFAIAHNFGIKQPEGLERNVSDLESFSVGKIWENPARIFCLSPVKSWERNEMEREPAGRYRAEGEGVKTAHWVGMK